MKSLVRRKVTYRAIGLVVVAVWSSCFVAIRGTEGLAPPLLYAALRALCASTPLLLISALTRRLLPPPGSWPWLLALALGSTTFGLAGMFLSVGLSGTVLPAVLTNSQVILVAPAAAWLFSESLAPRQVAGLLLGTAGVAVTIGFGAQGSGVANSQGLALGLMAAVGVASGNLVMKKLGPRVDGLTAVSWQYALGGLVLLGWSFVSEAPFQVEWTTRLTIGLLYLGVVSSALGSYVWYRLLQVDDLTPLNGLTLVGPALSVTLSWLLFREPIGPASAAGIVATLIGVALAGAPSASDGKQSHEKRPRWPTDRPAKLTRC